MRALWTGFLLLVSSVSAAATPLTQGDIAALRAMSDGFVKGWMDNDRQAVMSSFSKDAVFIPHDGVRPKVGYAEIDQFWFPHGKASGVIPAFTHAISSCNDATGTLGPTANAMSKVAICDTAAKSRIGSYSRFL